jgi:RP/EB family microtubule-associated protein
MTESIGMMEGAFFVPKKDLLTWVNNILKLNLTTLDQVSTGALYCQIIDAVHPNKVKMSKVNWKAKLEHEILHNYKILQQAFTDCNINKNIDVEKLAKGRAQENLEFLQWLKKYYDVNNPGGEYDAEKRRNGMGLDTEDLNIKKRDNSKNRDPVLNSKLKKTETEKSKKTINLTLNENKENCEPNKEISKSK